MATTRRFGGSQPKTRPDDARGGAGRSQGRKPVDPAGDTVRVTIRMTQEQIDWLKHLGPNLSDTVRALIDQARAA